MKANTCFEVAVIGGGIVGTAVAMAILEKKSIPLVLLEAESKLAAHQTGHNSGVIHSGLYYKPGSLKAQNCARGRELLTEFCRRYHIPFEICGKIVVAVDKGEEERLEGLALRGEKNGLTGIKRLTSKEIKDYEPHVSGISGLYIPQTGIVDYKKVTEKFGEIIQDKGGVIHLNSKLKRVNKKNGELVLHTTGQEYRCKYLVNCAGLHSDRVAKICGEKPGLKIIPFRGEYYALHSQPSNLVRNLIYPVPDPNFPFLGVHFTRMMDGEIEAGPNAVPAFKRHGYKKTDFSLNDTLEILSYPGFLKLALKNWQMGLGEIYRSFSKKAFLKALKKLIPELEDHHLKPAAAGVRAQALEVDGNLVDDFRLLEGSNMIHVLNAPSPAATASISIGKLIAEKAIMNFNL